MYKLIKKLLNKKFKPIATLENILIKAADEKLEIILKKEFSNQAMYLPLDRIDKQFIRKNCGTHLNKKFYYYVIDNCIFVEQH